MTLPIRWLCIHPSSIGIDWSVLGSVMLGVGVLMLAIRVLGMAAVRFSGAARVRPSVVGTTAPIASPEREHPLTPELVAVLTAAATTVLGEPVRVCAISVGKMAAQRGWSMEGRREIYLSHRIR